MLVKIIENAGKLKANQHFASLKGFADAAHRWRDEGYLPFPLGLKGNDDLVPVIKWGAVKSVSDAEIELWFGPECAGIAIKTGTKSGGLIDIDLDCPEAVKLAPHFLPDTDCIFGRPSNPASHFLYYVELPNKIKKTTFQSPSGGKPIVEILADGQISTVPPTVKINHDPSEKVSFEIGKAGLPSEVHYTALQTAVRRLAAASVILRAYPAEGSRHNAAVALSGALLRADLSVEDTKKFIEAIAKAANDPEVADRLKVVNTTAAKLANDEACWGWHKLSELLGVAGPGVVKACRKWLQGPDADPAKTLVTVKASDIVVRPVTWLWKDRIACGTVSIIDGDPGEGKSTITIDLTARVSAGMPFPSGDQCEPAGVVIVSCEDSIDTTVVPRLKAAGADLEKVRLVKGVPDGDGLPRMLSIPEDLGALRDEIKSIEARLVVIEPLLAFISLNTHSHNDQQVRRALGPLAALAEETGAAVLAVRHLTKKPGGQALYRGQGSIGIIGAARTAFLAGPDPHAPDSHVLAMTKNNLGELARSWRYRIVGKSSAPGEEPAWSASAIEWGEECDIKANALVPEKTRSSKALDAAVEYLDDILGDGPMMVNTILTQAEAAGHSKSTIKRAADELGVDKSQVHADGKIKGWQWTLPVKTASVGGAEASDISPPPWALTSYGKS